MHHLISAYAGVGALILFLKEKNQKNFCAKRCFAYGLDMEFFRSGSSGSGETTCIGETPKGNALGGLFCLGIKLLLGDYITLQQERS